MMHPVTLTFADPALERGYAEEKARSLRRLYRIFSLVAVVFGTLLAFADENVLGTEANMAVIRTLRLAIVVPVAVLVIAVGWTPEAWFRRLWQPAVASAGFIGLMVGVIGGALLPDPEAMDLGLALGSIILVNVAVGSAFSLRFVYALAAIALPNALLLSRIAARFPQYATTTGLLLGSTCLFSLIAAYQVERRDRLAFLSSVRSEELLRNVLPAPIGERLKRGEAPIADRLPEVTVLFADIVGFTEVSRTLDSDALVAQLDELFSEFDAIADRHGLEKIKTIGDAYMVVAGVPVPRADHAHAVAAMALDLRDAIGRHPPVAGRRLQIRIGIHSGPVTAGVIGKRKFIYDVWGDTVNTASRMESHGVADEIQLTDETRALLGDAFALVPRGVIAIKGIGDRPTWLLRGRA